MRVRGKPAILREFSSLWFLLIPRIYRIPKLDVIGSIPIARSNISFKAFRQTLAEVCQSHFSIHQLCTQSRQLNARTTVRAARQA
jgi:hypothetical protein